MTEDKDIYQIFRKLQVPSLEEVKRMSEMEPQRLIDVLLGYFENYELLAYLDFPRRVEELIKQRESLSYRKGFAEKVNVNVGFLRQWLNEDRITDLKKMVTDEELHHWLSLKDELDKETNVNRSSNQKGA